MKNLDIQQTELMDLVDEKIASKDLKELQNFFANAINGDDNTDLRLTNYKCKSNKHAKISKEFINLMIKVLKEIDDKNPVTIAGKKSRVNAQQAMKLINTDLDGFNKMIDDNIIKCFETERGFYVHMEDIPKGRKIMREQGEAILKKFTQQWQAEQAEMAENTA